MNAGQEKFYQFILMNVAEENQEQAKALLNESFAKQDDGTFDAEYMAGFMGRMLPLIREDRLEQVKQIMMDHQKKTNH